MILLQLFLLFWMMPGKNDGIKEQPLKPIARINLQVPEPSDFCFDGGDSVFVVSDQGALYKCSIKNGRARLLLNWGYDLEGICRIKDSLWLLDERYRLVAGIGVKDKAVTRIFEIPYLGARNSGFESIAYSDYAKQMVLATEKNPCCFYFFDERFNPIGRCKIDGIEEVSSMIWKNRYLYVLSDDEGMIYKVDENKKIIGKYKLPIWNPEGIGFDEEGNCWILSDDYARMYNVGKLND